MAATAKLVVPTAKELLEVGGIKIGEIHTVDPKAELLTKVGFIAELVEIPSSKILVAIYYRPEKTAGGIIDPTAQQGDSYQGKIGLVLKMGPLAFQDDETHTWGDVRPKVGDWVQFRVGDTAPWRLGKNEQSPHFRYVEDVNILAIWKRPDLVW